MLTRPETVALLQRRIPELDARLADELAAELGDLPLAAAQAAAYLEQTGLPPAAWAASAPGGPACWPKATCWATRSGWTPPGPCRWSGSDADSPAAVPLLELAAFLAPEPIPLSLFSAHPELLDEPLRAAPPTRTPWMTCWEPWSACPWPAARPTASSCTAWSRRSSASSSPPPSQQTTTDRVLALLAAAHPGTPSTRPTGSGMPSSLPMCWPLVLWVTTVPIAAG